LLFACGPADSEPSPLNTRVAQGALATQAPAAAPPVATAPPGFEGSDVSAQSCGATNPDSRLASVPRSGQRSFSTAPERVIDPEKKYTAVMKTSKGEVRMELAAREIPGASNNFVFLACTGYYDGLTFHRVVLTPQPFVIQGGDPLGDGTGGPGYRIPDEFSPNWRHITGALAMARSSAPNSAGSQFYITLAPQPGLDNQYTVFGRVIYGMEVVRAIRQGDRITRVDILEE
jgi:cyclophilin family peptidyl-prolyl cis-trans isomerase